MKSARSAEGGPPSASLESTRPPPICNTEQAHTATYPQPIRNLRCMNHRGQYDQPRGVQHRVTAHRWKALDLCLRIRAAAHHENQLAGRYELISHDFSLLGCVSL